MHFTCAHHVNRHIESLLASKRVPVGGSIHCELPLREALPESLVELRETISRESGYAGSDRIPFLPVHRLNSPPERTAAYQAMHEVIESGQFTSGPFVGRVETAIGSAYGAECVGTSSGTTALTAALMAVGVGPEDEVVLPPNSFAATVNAVLALGATPVFANVDESHNLDPLDAARVITGRTAALLFVALHGSTENLEEVKALAESRSLALVIDAAQAFGLFDVVDKCDALALSFNPFKNVGAWGKAGAVVARDAEVIRTIREFTYHGFAPGRKNYKVREWGINARLDNLQAAILLSKLGRLTLNGVKRTYLAHRYLQTLGGERIQLPSERAATTWHLFPIRIESISSHDAIAAAHSRGVELELYYPELAFQGEGASALDQAERRRLDPTVAVRRGLVHLPLHNQLSLAEQDRVIEAVLDVAS